MPLPRFAVVGGSEHGQIGLRAAAWVSPKTLLRAIRQQQRFFLGRDNRPVSERTVRLVGFWREQHADGRTYEQARRAWNRAHPAWQYDDTRGFLRAATRGEKAIATVRPALRLWK